LKEKHQGHQGLRDQLLDLGTSYNEDLMSPSIGDEGDDGDVHPSTFHCSNFLRNRWRVSTTRWEPQEEGMMSTVASLPSVVKPKLNQTSRRKPNFRR
jgi:hypothetical protein